MNAAQRRRLAAGLCRECEAPATRGQLCARHRARHHAYSLAAQSGVPFNERLRPTATLRAVGDALGISCQQVLNDENTALLILAEKLSALMDEPVDRTRAIEILRFALATEAA